MSKKKMKLRDLWFYLYAVSSMLPFIFHRYKVSAPQFVGHEGWAEHLALKYNKKGLSVLEIGSRVVTGNNFRSLFSEAEYIGFDFHDGPNVDIVGDAHKLGRYFPPEKRFDLIFSSAVFEHLYAPWLVAEQMSRLLKVGGWAFVETHFSFVSHERPWHFFQFSDMGLKSLFNQALGFRCLDSGMSNPMGGYFNIGSAPYLRFKVARELYCHSEILVEKVYEVSEFDWNEVSIEKIVGDTLYPKGVRS